MQPSKLFDKLTRAVVLGSRHHDLDLNILVAAAQSRRREGNGDVRLDLLRWRCATAAAAARSLLTEKTIHVDGPATAATEKLAEELCGLGRVHFLSAAGPGAPAELEAAARGS